MLYAKQVAAGRFGEARQTLDSIVQLLGLAAPEKVELYDFSGYSDQQLAQEVAHELPELLREAERLTRGAARRTERRRKAARAAGSPTPRRLSSGSSSTVAAKEAFYGGAAGGGKTDALLMAALAYVDIPATPPSSFAAPTQISPCPGR